jgi:hypothetical protein
MTAASLHYHAAAQHEALRKLIQRIDSSDIHRLLRLSPEYQNARDAMNAYAKDLRQPTNTMGSYIEQFRAENEETQELPAIKPTQTKGSEQ